MLVAVYLRADDGGISVLYPAGAPASGETPAAFAKRVADRDLPAGTQYRIIDSAALPVRRWRAAWKSSGGTLSVDLTAARAARKAELLAERDLRLDRVRRKLSAATEDDDAPKLLSFKNRAKALRALDANLDGRLVAIADLAALDAFTPAEFGQVD